MHATEMDHHITAIKDLVGTQKTIWDKLIVIITPEATTVAVGIQVGFKVTAVYAYDNVHVREFDVSILRDGAHFATNNFTDTSDIPATHQYTTENISEKSYGLTAFTANPATVTWTSKPFEQLVVDWITSNALILILSAQVVIVLALLLIRERRKHTSI